MAEAVVEEPNRQRRTFFCHSCSIEFNSTGDTDYTCPNCFEGFIEELPADPPTPAPTTQQDPHNWRNFMLSDFWEGRAGSSAMSVNDSPYYRIANDLLSPMILASAGRLSGTEDAENAAPLAVGTVVTPGGTNRRSRPSRRNGGGGGGMNFENILQEILFSISEGAGEGAGGPGGSQMVFMGNPNDYAWGREGLDTIVTQLLNQMDNSGPPPLDKEKINDIPKVEITEDQVESKLQCSVCWEDFKLTESVRKLPCLHVYHEECIIPWLELHGTCPICRKVLVPEQAGDDAAPRNAWTSTAQAVAQHLRQTLGGGSSSNQSHVVDDTDDEMGDMNSSAITIDSSSDNDTTTDRTNSRFRDDDGNVEFEYD